MQPTVAALKQLLERLPVPTKRETDNNSSRIGKLFWRLNAGQVKPEVQGRLTQLVAALEAGDLATAEGIQVNTQPCSASAVPFAGIEVLHSLECGC